MIIYLCFSNAFSTSTQSVLLDKLGIDGADGWTDCRQTGVTTWLKEWHFKDTNKNTIA